MYIEIDSLFIFRFIKLIDRMQNAQECRYTRGTRLFDNA